MSQLPTTGPISLRQISDFLGLSSDRPFRILSSDARELFGVSAGNVNLTGFRGKALEILRSITEGQGLVNAESLFGSDWTVDRQKRLKITSDAAKSKISKILEP